MFTCLLLIRRHSCSHVNIHVIMFVYVDFQKNTKQTTSQANLGEHIKPHSAIPNFFTPPFSTIKVIDKSEKR